MLWPVVLLKQQKRSKTAIDNKNMENKIKLSCVLIQSESVLQNPNKPLKYHELSARMS